MAGFYGQGLRLCREALKIQPKDPRAIEICAVAACNLGKDAEARGYYAMASGLSQSQIHRVCLSKGIDLTK
jgi:Flp pilus assembly protein TadD